MNAATLYAPVRTGRMSDCLSIMTLIADHEIPSGNAGVSWSSSASKSIGDFSPALARST